MIFLMLVHILVLDNPFPEIAKFYFSPVSGEASVCYYELECELALDISC